MQLDPQALGPRSAVAESKRISVITVVEWIIEWDNAEQGCPTGWRYRRDSQLPSNTRHNALSLFVLSVKFTYTKKCHMFSALINSRSAGNFRDLHTATQLCIPLLPLYSPIPLHSMDNRFTGTGKITHCTPLLSISIRHSVVESKQSHISWNPERSSSGWNIVLFTAFRLNRYTGQHIYWEPWITRCG